MGYLAGLMNRALILISGAIGWPCFLFFSLLTGFLAVPAQLLALPFDPLRRVGSAVMRAVWCKAQFALQPFWHLHWSGLENVGEGPYVIVANHRSMIDIVTCITLPLEVKVMARGGIFRIPMIGWFMSLTRQIRVDAGDPASLERAYTWSKELLARGISVVVFPEGSRSTTGEVGTFHKGAFRIAKDAGVPVLPIAIQGAHLIMYKGRAWPSAFHSHVHARALPVLEPEDFGSARKLTSRARAVIVDALESP